MNELIPPAMQTNTDTTSSDKKEPAWSEGERVAALQRYAILDTPREPEFDDVVRLAADLFGAPISIVNLIAADRQWFKAEVGVGTNELPLDASLCAHAILQPDIFVVPDTTKDERFASNPLVTGSPSLRFYAGALLQTSDGFPIGTVCVLDTKPRPEGITEQQRLALGLLARQVMTQLELRREITLRDERAARLEAEIAGRIAADQAQRDSERRLNAVLDNTRMAVFMMDEHQQCVYANAAAEALTGYSLGQMQGRPLHDVVHHTRPDGSHYPLHECPIDRAFPERAQMDGEEMFVRPDGSFYPVGFTASPLLDDHGQAVGTVIEARDITANRARDAALRESEARFRNMADHAPIMMWVTDVEGRCTYLNRGWYEFTGQDERAAEGFGWLDAVHPEDRAWSGDVFLAANAKAEPFRLEYRLRYRDGSYRWAIDAASPRFGSQGEFLGYIGSVIDIHERREAENALRTSEERYRTLFEAIDAGFCIVEVIFDGERAIDYRFVEANPAFERQTGLVDAAGRTALELVPGLEEVWFERYGHVARTGEPIRFENGSEAMGRWFDVHALRVGPPEARRVAILFNDISARRNAELKLREMNDTLELRIEEAVAERKLWADVIENTDALIGVMSPEFRFLALNAAYADEFERIYGVRPRAGDALPDLMERVPEHRDAVLGIWRRALAGEEFTIVQEFGTPERARPFFELRYNALHDRLGRFVGAFQYAVDVSDRLRDQARLADAEEQLRQAQKMEAVGQLTGGIAHDFNNLLAGISGSLEIIERRLSSGRTEGLERFINGAQTSARRAAALTQRLLAFSRRQTLDPKPTDVNRLVFGMEDLIRRTVGPAIKVEVVGAGGLWSAKVDPAQLESALLNLAINARDAMPGGGRLTIETANKWLDDRGARSRDIPPGQYLSICVTDSGTGIPKDVVDRIFDPFFTTKPIGQGTGLGLSMIHGFMRQSGGQVRVYTEEGQGTTMCLYLPRFLGEIGEDEAPEEAISDDGTGRTVLVIDDEATVRMLIVEVLEEAGYTAIEADDGPSGLKVLQSPVDIDLLVTDVGLPGGMNGRQVADAARELRPDLKVLFVTGFAENAAIGNGHLPHGMGVVTKPFVMAELGNKIAEMLEA
ncbi:PAS domain S-box protein [Aureimonas psammosilenae]|uniref:PAS domain S-box protein n=1 Tax=Aureimonas psammosilenae TaxID=2495496 RepID=UPI0012613359|nr:PAS domain S-box protein [Aureimonas psammosilenae]